MPAPPFLGVDFGTTNSSMACCLPEAGRAEIVRDAEGNHKTPSLVFFGEDETVVGAAVQDLLADARGDAETQARVVHSVKRALLHPPRIALPGGRAVRPVEVAAEILGKLKRDAERQNSGEELSRAVITCPAIFDGAQRQAIVEAAGLAGFEEVELVEEPVAAALAFEHAGGQVGNGVLVYDFGGGTFDAAFVVREPGEDRFELALEPEGDPRCGGDDIDQALYDYFDREARRELGRPISLEEGKMDLNFLRTCRRRKESLSKSRHATFSTRLEGGVAFRAAIDRDEFEELIQEPVDRTVRITAHMAERAREEGHPVDTVLLVGGSSQLPLVQRRISEALELEPQRWGHRDVAVALGAAHYANTLWGQPQPHAEPLAPSERYRRAVELMWSDQQLEPHEADRLEALRQELQLTKQQVCDIEREIIGIAKEELAPRGSEKYDVDVPVRPGVASSPWANCKEVATFLHHKTVNAVAFAPDSSYLATVCDDKAAHVWGLPDGRELTSIKHHGFLVILCSLAVAPDGGHLLTGSNSRVEMWELPHGRSVGGRDVAVCAAVAIRYDGRQIAFSTQASGPPIVDVVEFPSWELVHEFESLPSRKSGVKPPPVAFSPDGRYLAVGSVLWDVRDHAAPKRLGTPLDEAISFSRDGTYFAAAGQGRLMVWELENLEPVMSGEAGIECLALSPDGHWLATGGSDGTARVWRVVDATEILRIDHSGYVSSVAFSDNGSYLATASRHGDVHIWEPLIHGGSRESQQLDVSDEEAVIVEQEVRGHTREEFIETGATPTAGLDSDGQVSGSPSPSAETRPGIAGPQDEATQAEIEHGGAAPLEPREVASIVAPAVPVGFTHDATRLAVVASDVAVMHEIPSGRPLARLRHKGLLSSIDSLLFHPHDEYVLTLNGKRAAWVWDAVSGERVARLSHDRRAHVSQAIFSPDGRYIATVDRTVYVQGDVRLWEVGSWRQLARFAAMSAAFSPDGRYFAADRLCNAQSLSELMHLAPVPRSATVFSPGGRYLAATAADGKTLGLWDTDRLELVRTTEYARSVRCLGFSSSGKYFATTVAPGCFGTSDQIEVCEAASGRKLIACKGSGPVLFSPDEREVAITEHSSFHTDLKVFDISTGRSARTLRSVVENYHSQLHYGFAAEGGYFWAVGDGVQVWALPSWQHVASLAEDTGVGRVCFTDDWRYVATGGTGAGVRVWQISRPSGPN
jgi:WD40 repeat protein/actin-like ATPase involved in cell morphogenesis